MAYTTFGWGHDWTRFHKSERSRLFPSAPTKSATSCNFPGQFRPELYSTPNFETVSQSITGIFSNVRRAKGILVRPSGKDIAFLGRLVNEGKPDIFSRSRGRGTCS